MAEELKIKRINIKEYDISKWEELIDTIYPVISQIFVMEKEQLAKSVFYQQSMSANLYLFYADDNLVGINLTNIYEYNYKGKDYSFFRFLSGILPEHRGKSNVQRVGFVEAFKYATLNPLRNIYYLGPLIHPSSYAAACKVSSKVYPSLKNKVPKNYFDLMVTVADVLGLERIEGESPLVRDIKVKTIDSADYKPKRISNRAKFFIELNPNYKKGYGLITFAPMDFKNVSESFMRYYSKKIKIPKITML